MMAMIGDDHTIRIFEFMMVIRANIAKSILYAFARINHVIGSTLKLYSLVRCPRPGATIWTRTISLAVQPGLFELCWDRPGPTQSRRQERDLQFCGTRPNNVNKFDWSSPTGVLHDPVNWKAI